MIDIGCAVAVTVWFCVWAWPLAGTWNGYLSPAAAPMKLTSAKKVADVVVFSGVSARLRPQCSPRSLDWRLGKRGAAKTQPVVVNWGKPINHPDGVFEFEGWTAEMDDVDEFRFNTFSDVLHQCYLFAQWDQESETWRGGWSIPWLVRSPFWN